MRPRDVPDLTRIVAVDLRYNGTMVAVTVLEDRRADCGDDQCTVEPHAKVQTSVTHVLPPDPVLFHALSKRFDDLACRYGAGTGWELEDGDPTVGVFGRAMYHMVCVVDDGPAGVVGDENWQVIATTTTGTGVERVHWHRMQIKCPTCGEIYEWFEREDDPEYAEV